ncbi:hypothetical protein HHK36_011024 [Tetracentron sinense]|uniref:Uncharacterized protein n=1 Tax=Tetracentron sinense TaxID=13715 RepID=A0A835DGZ6_TETSI|nr:hypothetical protein HHK36_011024 [Tetracentron sinense]
MVLQKRLDYGFHGYQVPAIPRASRSARRRGSLRINVNDNQMCDFELLATVADKLLQEGKSSAPSNASAGKDPSATVKDSVKQEQHDEENLLKVEPSDQVSCEESVFVSEIFSQGHNQNYTLKKFLHAQNDDGLGFSSEIATSEHSEKVGCAVKLTICKHKNLFGNFPSKVEGGSPNYGESCEDIVEDKIDRKLEAEPRKIESLMNGTVADKCSSEDPMELDRKSLAFVSSDSSVEVPLSRDRIPFGSFPGHQDDVKVVSRDDDENSSGCTQPSTIIKAFRTRPRIGDRIIRKFLEPRYWKGAPKLKDDEEMKAVYRNRKICYTRQRSQRNLSCKRRKLFNRSSVLTSDGISSEGISSSPEKGINGDATGSGVKMHGASGASSSVSGQQASFQSRDSDGRQALDGVMVPELFIEIPETATVGSLKRAVMEAVTAILGGGLHVGVLIQGKKIRDDNKTLLQTGISHDDRMDTLGFMLEPNPAQAPPPPCLENSSFLLPSDIPQPLTRYPATPTLNPVTSDASPDPPESNLGNCVESDHDSVLFPTDISTVKTTLDSRALVAIPSMSVEALAVVPIHRKSSRSELVQRRMRRPFSVTEVEALVQAVEKLGTGRWRDVKLRAFDNAKHRTYVDLKDKWKTLVHTARISPLQRRGEPVPQELLDRVLSAHAYWSQQQVKQQSENWLLL